MRLLILCERIGTTGGTERYLQNTVPLLATHAEVRLLAREIEDSAAFSVPCEQLAWSDEHDAPDRFAGDRLRREIERFKPDAVVTHNVLDSAVLAAAREAPRLVHHLHDHRPFCPNGDRAYPRTSENCAVAMGNACLWHSLIDGCAYGPRPRTARLLRRRLSVRDALRAGNAIVVLSEFMAQLALKNRCDAARVHVVAPPLPDDAFAQSVAPKPADHVVLFAGRIMPLKGLSSLVHAIASIETSRRPLLAIAGDGPALPEAREQAAHRGVAVRALGHLEPAELRGAMDDATVVAIPSLWAEPFGLIGIEAQARGRPVVAYDVGATPEWIDGSGTLVPRKNTSALAAAIQTFLEDPQAWKDASVTGLRHSRKYETAQHAARLLHLYAGSAT